MQTSLQGGDILSWDLKTEEQPKGQVQEKISGKKLENKPVKLGAGEKGRSEWWGQWAGPAPPEHTGATRGYKLGSD